MNENIIPGLASRRYVHKLASFAPLILRNVFYNADEGVWYYRGDDADFIPLPDAESYKMYLSDETDCRAHIRDMYRRLYRGFPSTIMLKVISYQSTFMMPLETTGIYFENHGLPIVTYQSICDFRDSHDGVQGKHILSLQVCVPDDHVDLWIGHFQVLPAKPDCATVEDIRELRTLIAATEAAQTATEQAIAALSQKLIPTGLKVSAIERITLGNVAENVIEATLQPNGTMPNIIFISDNKAVRIDQSGHIKAIRIGASEVQIIPTCNTALAKTIIIRVEAPTLRLVNTRKKIRITESGAILLN